MRKNAIFLWAIAVFSFFSFSTGDPYRQIDNDSFGTGEILEYRVHYGFINAGEASVRVSPKIHTVNNRPCYEVTAFGKSVGAFDWITRIRDTWQSYIDTSAMLPHRFRAHIEEGKYRKDETVYFDHTAHTIRSVEKDEATKDFHMPANVQDVVSGYYFLRTIDFNRLHTGDIVPIPGFFDDKLYDFKIRYIGKEDVNTKFGKVRCIKIYPLMPKNEMFDGESSIRVWVTDDKNKIPVKIEADLFMGAVAMDLKGYKGLKNTTTFRD